MQIEREGEEGRETYGERDALGSLRNFYAGRESVCIVWEGGQGLHILPARVKCLPRVSIYFFSEASQNI